MTLLEVTRDGGRHEVRLDDLLQSVLVGVCAQEAGAAEHAHAAVDPVVLQPDHQHHAVVEAGADDAPLVDQCFRIREVLVLADAGVDLRVHDQLGAGVRLDAVDRLLELRLSAAAEDVRRVVDRLVLDRVGKGGTGRQGGRGGERQERERARERASPSVHVTNRIRRGPSSSTAEPPPLPPTRQEQVTVTDAGSRSSPGIRSVTSAVTPPAIWAVTVFAVRSR